MNVFLKENIARRRSRFAALWQRGNVFPVRLAASVGLSVGWASILIAPYIRSAAAAGSLNFRLYGQIIMRGIVSLRNCPVTLIMKC